MTVTEGPAFERGQLPERGDNESTGEQPPRRRAHRSRLRQRDDDTDHCPNCEPDCPIENYGPPRRPRGVVCSMYRTDGRVAGPIMATVMTIQAMIAIHSTG